MTIDTPSNDDDVNKESVPETGTTPCRPSDSYIRRVYYRHWRCTRLETVCLCL